METLDKTILETREKEISEKFEEVQKSIREIEHNESLLAQQKSGLNVELFRLQGEHRLIKDLLKPAKTEKEEVN